MTPSPRANQHQDEINTYCNIPISVMCRCTNANEFSDSARNYPLFINLQSVSVFYFKKLEVQIEVCAK